MKNIYEKNSRKYLTALINLLEKNSNAKFLDLGCDDGRKTLMFTNKIGTKKIYGIDINKNAIEKARMKGIKVREADLNKRFPFNNNSFDVIVANQVIEHIIDLDNFVKEVYRVLKKNGYFILCTENLASWHNILALLFAFQPFSLTNIVKVKLGLGNPLALYRNKKVNKASWLHQKVLTFNALIELLKAYNFKVERAIGIGYYPFSFLAKIDKRHAHFVVVKVRKK